MQATHRFELYDKMNSKRLALDQLCDIRLLNNCHFILVLLNESENTDQQHFLTMQNDISTGSDDNTLSADHSSDLKDIMKDKVSGNRYACYFSKCRKTFKHIHQLLEHSITHSKSAKPFTCKVEGCGKAFTSQKRLEVHNEVHLEVGKHKCPIEGCDKAFK